MPLVRPATSADLPAVSVYLSKNLGGDGGPGRFTRFFEYDWVIGKSMPRDLGMMIEDNGRIRGFIGAIYGVREIRGQDYKLCNINSWCVDDDARSYSLAMLKGLLARKDHEFTCLSPSERVVEVLRFLKFETLDTKKIIYLPLSGLPASPRLWRVKVHDAKSGIEARLAPEELRVYRDHARYRLEQWLIERGTERCLVVMGKRGRGLRIFADVLYASNPNLFSETIGMLGPRLVRAFGTVLVGIDRRFVHALRPPRTVEYGGLRTMLYRSQRLAAIDMNALYTEFVPMFG